ncbi:hypothetical protein CMO89_02725 [Candidatus Woesearchaeota archaeon]|nr:hypothetical protein [Candidatus Woesearchaeota archaeon]|tara:strand:- start:18676 stop:19245 length:570 start_codon:yes stop_codon:yes gene_type:complete
MIKKTKKKSWYRITESKLLNGQVIGELTAFEPESVIGRHLTLNLMSITDNPKLQHINLKFSIDSVADNGLKASVVGYYFSPSSIKRLVKRGCRRTDDSFVCKTKEGRSVRLKPFFVTRTYTSHLIVSKLRKTARVIISEMVGKLSFDKLINDILNHKLQAELKKQLNKVYPLKSCEIRFLELIAVKVNK